jgi:hypothetical protein
MFAVTRGAVAIAGLLLAATRPSLAAPYASDDVETHVPVSMSASSSVISQQPLVSIDNPI